MQKYIILLVLGYTFFISHPVLLAQTLRINEIMSSNSIYEDEDGNTPDWIEIHNYGQELVSLDGMYISDDNNNPTKWQFENLELAPDEYMIVWASDKDRQAKYYKTLVTQGDIFRYYLPMTNTSSWVTPNFDDSSWSAGPSGFGYGDGDDATLLPFGTQSAFLRTKFFIEDPSKVEKLLLDIDYDDGYLAYINGNFVAASNVADVLIDTGTPTATEVTFEENGTIERKDISDNISLLVAGENTLAIQIKNHTQNSSDLSVIPFLTILESNLSSNGIKPPEFLNYISKSVHTNFKISSSGETISLYNSEIALIDRVESGNFPANKSIGYLFNDIRLFDLPTPGRKNADIAYDGYVDSELNFSHEGGIVNAGLQVSLSGAGADEVIRYTRDGSLPTGTSSRYEDPISITSNTILRARIFKQGFLPSDAKSRTYLVDIEHDLPIVSLVVDPKDFFDEETGIYSYGDDYRPQLPFFGANFWKDEERAASFTLLSADGKPLYSQDVGAKIFGGWSRANNQRSLSLFARKKYGESDFNHKFFDSRAEDKFSALVLRNTGNDWLRGGLRDIFFTSLMEGSGVDVQAFQSVACYINGDYWGYYNLREKINEHFVANKYDLDPDEINLLEIDSIIKSGSNSDYIELFKFIENNNLTEQDNYEYVSSKIDIENFIIYNVAQIFASNWDWPGNNRKFWTAPNRKWQWILFDTDFGFSFPYWGPQSLTHNTLSHALEANGPEWPNPPHSTLFLRKLMFNLNFRNNFINRFADELNSRFLPANVNDHLDNLSATLSNELPKHLDRWGGSEWTHKDELGKIKTFADQRPAIVKEHILRRLNIPAYHQLNLVLRNEERGSVLINNRLDITTDEWSGDYFQSVPISLSAISKSGFEFSHWSGDVSSTSETIQVNMLEPMTINANFVKDGTATEELNSSEQIHVYPNPFSDFLVIANSIQSQKVMAYELLNEQGVILMKETFSNDLQDNEKKISTSELVEGIYFLNFKLKNGQHVQTKVVKK